VGVEKEMTAHELITITTKRKLGKKKMNELWDKIMDVVGEDNLETAGGKPLTARQFTGVWLEAHK
jgi:hypothetical protein